MILTVPTVTNALRGIEQPDEVEFCGGFDKVKRRMSSQKERMNCLDCLSL